MIEFKTGLETPAYFNPLGLSIGDQVKVSATTTVEYNDEGDKVLVEHPCNSKRVMIITGTVKKATGKYIKGWGGFYDPESYEQAQLKIDKYHWLYECKRFINDKPQLVHSDNIEKLN